jgi:hypothetical protein
LKLEKNVLSLARSSYESMVFNEEFEKRINSSKFSLKENSIVKFQEIKNAIKDEVLNENLYNGVQVSSNFKIY